MLTVSNLTVVSPEGRRLLEDVSLTLERNEHICLTGASGAGKSTLIRTIFGTAPDGLTVVSGDIRIDGDSILRYAKQERRRLCGTQLGFIPQNSMTAFFSSVRVGKQLTETYKTRLGLNKADALALAKDTLRRVNLTDTQRILDAFPSQLSGGMLQRVAMSMILGMHPTYILADEPTSALDALNREHLIRLLREYSDGGVLFISHDTPAIEQLCSRVFVMERGRIIEEQDTARLFSSPREEWTRRFVEASKKARGEAGRWKRSW